MANRLRVDASSKISEPIILHRKFDFSLFIPITFNVGSLCFKYLSYYNEETKKKTGH